MTIEQLKENGWKDENGHYWNDPDSNEWVIYEQSQVRKSHSYLFPKWFTGLAEDRWLNMSHRLFLESVGRTLEEYYVRFILNWSEVPKCACPGCENKVTMFCDKMSHGIRESCCLSHARSVANYRMWEDKTSVFNSEEYKKVRSELFIKIYNDPNSFYHKEEYKSLMRKIVIERNEDPAYREKQSLAQLRSYAASHDRQDKQSIARSRINKLMWADENSVFNTKEFRDKKNKVLLENFESGNCGCTGIRSIYHSDRFNVDLRCDSTYESRFAELLTSLDQVTSIQRPGYYMYYDTILRCPRRYYPDFMITYSGITIIIEVKPEYRLTDQNVIDKSNAITKHCNRNGMKYIILTENEFYIDNLISTLNSLTTS